MDESALQCGVASAVQRAGRGRDLRDAGIAPSAVHNNCSGKHAGILGAVQTAWSRSVDVSGTGKPRATADSRLVRAPFGRCASRIFRSASTAAAFRSTPRRCEMRRCRLCGSRRSTPSTSAMPQALLVVRDAMTAHPEYVSGTGEFDTRLMQSARTGDCVQERALKAFTAAHLSPRAWAWFAKSWTAPRAARAPAVLAAIRAMGLMEPSAYDRNCRLGAAGRV